MGLNERSVAYNGMDCLSDTEETAYMNAMDLSQAEIPWTYQPHYARATIYFGIVIVFIATLKHLWYRLRDRSYKKSRESSPFASFVDVLVAYFRFIAYKQVPVKVSFFTSMPPSVGTSFVFIISSFYLLCYCLIPHFWYRGCSGFGSPPLAVRAGVMATALTPFVYILSGKSNMITLLTGISYEKLNSTHQYVGVAAFVLSIIHTIPFIYQNLQEGGASNLYKIFFGEFAYYSGIPPFILLGILCIGSKACIRKHLYEGFLHLHWLCGIAYFGTLIWHIDKSLNMQNYMWGALAFWASQLIYRALVKTAFRPNALFLRPRAAELKKLDRNTYQVTVQNTKGLNWGPGQHCYLRFVGGKILDNHPFSISTIPTEEVSEMKFIIIPKKGLTKLLYDQLDEYVVSRKKVYIDGPYGGTSRDPSSFEKVVLISSGSGVTACLPFLSFLANAMEVCSKNGDRVVTREINFIWVIKRIDHLEWIKEELTRCMNLLGASISVSIYVCESDTLEEFSKSTEKKSNSFEVDIENSMDVPLITNYSNEININHFKPSVPIVLSDLKATLKRRNLIICSGSDSMKQSVSSIVSDLQPLIFNQDLRKNSRPIEEIHLHTESFGW